MNVVAKNKLGWWEAHRFLLARRFTQLAVLGLFLLGPWAGIWLIEGNLSASEVLNTVPLADPFVFLQSLASGHWPEITVVIGAAIVAVFYAVLGGRTYCSFVCPINPVTDLANWLRRKLGIRQSIKISRHLRLWILAGVLISAAITGVMTWELINPVSMAHRGLIFGVGAGWAIVVAVFLFDLLLVEHGWCGHACPMGATYALLGKARLIQVSAANRAACNDCMDCYAVCPEKQVLRGPVHGASRGHGPQITDTDCTLCGRCLEVCSQHVFELQHRFADNAEKAS